MEDIIRNRLVRFHTARLKKVWINRFTISDYTSNDRRSTCKQITRHHYRSYTFSKRLIRYTEERWKKCLVSPKEPVTIITMFYKETKALVRLPDDGITFFYFVVGVLQDYRLLAFLIIICLNYIPQTSIDQMKENGFILKSQEANDIPQKL